MTSLMFWCFHCWLWRHSTQHSGYKSTVFIHDFERLSFYWERNLFSLINMTRTFLNDLILTDLLATLKKYNFPANIYLFKVCNRNTRKRYKLYSRLSIKTPERRQCHSSGIFFVNFEHISHLFLLSIITLNMYLLSYCCSVPLIYSERWFKQDFG